MRALLLMPLLAGCIGSAETCVMDRLAYPGSVNGQVLVKIVNTDAHGITGQAISTYGNVQLATFRNPPGSITGGGICWGGGAARNQSADVVAWIDVAARLPAGCSGIAFDQCSPQPTDPRGHGTFVIRDFEQNYLDVAIKDP